MKGVIDKTQRLNETIYLCPYVAFTLQSHSCWNLLPAQVPASLLSLKLLTVAKINVEYRGALWPQILPKG